MTILLPALILLALAIFCAVLLTVASICFGVEESKTEAAIRDCLPGANCGACGYAGCESYAKALANDPSVQTNLCIPGGDKTAAAIAEILGTEAQDVKEMVAFVACNGTCGAVDKKYDYRGQASCRTANMSYSGDRYCTFACLGYGDCALVCPENAISVESGVARVDPKKCIGCGICVRTCPNHIIELLPDTARVAVECSSHNKGAVTKKFCDNGCIGCKKCEKTCEYGAIKVTDNLAHVDQSLCTACGECVKVCPVHCIHEGDFICGAH